MKKKLKDMSFLRQFRVYNTYKKIAKIGDCPTLTYNSKDKQYMAWFSLPEHELVEMGEEIILKHN